MDSSEIIKGACNCGRINVSVPRSSFPTFSSLCHCLNCRASSGSLSVLRSKSNYLAHTNQLSVLQSTWSPPSKTSKSKALPKFTPILPWAETILIGISVVIVEGPFLQKPQRCAVSWRVAVLSWRRLERNQRMLSWRVVCLRSLGLVFRLQGESSFSGERRSGRSLVKVLRRLLNKAIQVSFLFCQPN